MREFESDIEKIFRHEISEKKRVSSSNRHRTSRSGSNKNNRKVRFASESMNRKEKREHTKAGEVEVYNMYETIIPKHEFDLKPKDIQKAMLTRWREIYSNEKIMQEMNMNGNATFYRMLKELDIPQKTRGGNVRKGSKKTNHKSENLPSPKIQEVIHSEPVQLISNGLNLEYNGIYDAEQLTKILTKLQLIVDGEENKFRISFRVSEID